MSIKLKSKNREFRTELAAGRLHLLPTIRVNNWIPHYPFYHVSFLWLRWTWNVWWMNCA